MVILVIYLTHYCVVLRLLYGYDMYQYFSSKEVYK